MFDKIVKYLIVVTLVFTTVNVAGQEEWSVKGRVLSKKSAPVAGVAVSVEGVPLAPSITDSLGQFEIVCPSGDMWLLIAPIGEYQRKRIFINKRKEIDVYIQNSDVLSSYVKISTTSSPLERRDVLSSVIDMDVDMVSNLPYQTIDQFFQGRVPGMQVTNHSGMPGDATYSTIRGVSSMNTNNQPLYIVDGIPYENAGIFNSLIDGHSYSPLTSIDPQDITNVVVYKDGVATSLYGMKGSNGVVIIETLKPTDIKTTIDFNFRTGVGTKPTNIPVLNSKQYRTYAQEVLATSGQLEENYSDIYPGLYDDYYSENYNRYNNQTNWQDEVYRNSILTDVFFKVQGGDAIAKYGLSVGFMSHEGVVDNSNYTKTNIRFVGAFNIVEWLRLNLSSNFNYNKSNLMETGTSYQTSPVLTSIFKSPLMHPYEYDELGRELSYLDDVGDFNVSNPAAAINGFIGENNNYRLVTSANLEADITKKIKFNELLGVNFSSMSEQIFQPNIGMVLYYEDEAINVFKQQTNYFFSLYSDSRFSYNKLIDNKHNISGSAGFRVQTNSYEQDYAITRNLDASDEYKSITSGEKLLTEISGDNGTWNWMSMYATANYSFKDKYLLGASVSMDGSSQLGKDAETAMALGDIPIGVFPAISAGWRLSNESPLKNLDWLEELKLRASYGLSGNDQIGYYNSIVYYEPVRYRTMTGVVLGNIPNTELKYETYIKKSVGLDLSLLGERFSLSADYYENETQDMLIFERQDPYIGYPFRPTNGGSMINKGLDISINARVIKSHDLKWDISGYVSQYDNEVLSITGGSLVTDIEGGQIISSVGSPVNSFYGYVAEGVYPTSESATANRLVNEKGLPYRAGDVKYQDISGPSGIPDGQINKYDKTIIGSANPDFFGGISSSLKYQRWSLDALFTYSVGNDIFNYTRYQSEKMTDLSNQSAAVLRRWQQEGQITDIPRAVYDDAIGNTDFSTRWIEDGSNVKLSNLTLAYTIPNEVKLFGLEGLRNARIYMSATNVFTLSKYLGYNTEFSYGYDPLLQGVDYAQMPSVSTFIFGIKLGL